MVSILSISEHVSPSYSLRSSPVTAASPTDLDEADAMQVIHEPMGDRLIDLTRYGDLEHVQNVDIQCYQLTVSVFAFMWFDNRFWNW